MELHPALGFPASPRTISSSDGHAASTRWGDDAAATAAVRASFNIVATYHVTIPAPAALPETGITSLLPLTRAGVEVPSAAGAALPSLERAFLRVMMRASDSPASVSMTVVAGAVPALHQANMDLASGWPSGLPSSHAWSHNFACTLLLESGKPAGPGAVTADEGGSGGDEESGGGDIRSPAAAKSEAAFFVCPLGYYMAKDVHDTSAASSNAMRHVGVMVRRAA